VIAVNTFKEKDKCHAIPEVDMIADHGGKGPQEVDQLLAEWSHFGKVIMVDTDDGGVPRRNLKNRCKWLSTPWTSTFTSTTRPVLKSHAATRVRGTSS